MDECVLKYRFWARSVNCWWCNSTVRLPRSYMLHIRLNDTPNWPLWPYNRHWVMIAQIIIQHSWTGAYRKAFFGRFRYKRELIPFRCYQGPDSGFGVSQIIIHEGKYQKVQMNAKLIMNNNVENYECLVLNLKAYSQGPNEIKVFATNSPPILQISHRLRSALTAQDDPSTITYTSLSPPT